MKEQKKLFTALCAAFSALIFMGTLMGCSNIAATHGQVVTERQITSIKKGSDTKQTVMQKLGSPSTTGTFNENRWYYLTETTVSKPLNPNVLTERRLIAVEFDEKDIVNNIFIKTKDDGKEVPFSSKETPTQGQSFGIMDQMLNNVGKGF